jgi:hypothetical protein
MVAVKSRRESSGRRFWKLLPPAVLVAYSAISLFTSCGMSANHNEPWLPALAAFAGLALATSNDLHTVVLGALILTLVSGGARLACIVIGSASLSAGLIGIWTRRFSIQRRGPARTYVGAAALAWSVEAVLVGAAFLAASWYLASHP